MGNIYSYLYYEEQDTMLCVNSFAPSNKKMNYVITKVDHDDDEEGYRKIMFNH